MGDGTISHHTIVVKRTVNAPSARVFAAWRDASALERWYVPGDHNWTSRILEHDFRVGGRKHLAFGPRGEAPFEEDCRYEDVVEDARLCFSMTISRGKERLTTSMVTAELFPRGKETEVKVTDLLVILDGGDTAEGRERGWGETLDKLLGELNRQTS